MQTIPRVRATSAAGIGFQMVRPVDRLVLPFVGVIACLGAACRSEPSMCREIENLVLRDDEPSPAGVSGHDVLSLISTELTDSFLWRSGITNATAAANVTVQRTVYRTGDSVRFIESEQTGDNENDLGCGERLLIPVDIFVHTDDGALMDVFRGEVNYDLAQGPVTETSGASLHVSFEFEDLVGWLEPSSAEAHGELNVLFGVHESGIVASVVSTQNESDDAPTEHFEIAGSWGEAR